MSGHKSELPYYHRTFFGNQLTRQNNLITNIEVLTKLTPVTNLTLMPNTAILFLKEPGRSFTLSTRNICSKTKTLKLLVPGAELKIRAKSYSLMINKEAVGQIEDESIRQKIRHGLEKGLTIKFYVIKGNKQNLEVLIRCNKNIFNSQNLSGIRPFTKHEEVLEEGLTPGTEEADEGIDPLLLEGENF